MTREAFALDLNYGHFMIDGVMTPSRIKKIRKKYGMRQAAFADLLGVIYDTYSSWERGLNEHTNGLLRQFIPKKTEFTTITDEDIAKYQNLLDNRPRKILQFNTPIAVFLSSPVALAA